MGIKNLLSGRMSDADVAAMRASRRTHVEPPPSRNRMSPDLLAAHKDPCKAANAEVDLARRALSGNDAAERELRKTYGDKKAAQLIESEIQKSGGKPKAKSRFIKKILNR
jgi:hypothetical protein